MKLKTWTFIALIALTSVKSIAQEKEKQWGFEFGSGVSLATAKLGGTTLKPGLGFEGIFHYRFMQHTSVYAGWGWNIFSANKSFAGDHFGFEETGYVAGLQFKYPIGTFPVSYYVRVGGLYNHIEIENPDGKIINNTGHGFGWQLAGGIDMPLGAKWSFTPGIKFNSLSRDLEMEGHTTQLNLRYLSLRVGILKKF